MTEPLYTYEYETADGFKSSFLSRSDKNAREYILCNNQALNTFSAQKKYFIVKLTNTHTKEVIYEEKK